MSSRTDVRKVRGASGRGVCRLAEALEPRLFLHGAGIDVVVRPAGLDDPDDEIREARHAGNETFTAAIDSPTDVDMYVVTMTRGGTLTVDVDAPGGVLDSYLRLFFSSGGNAGAVNDRQGPSPEFSERESYFIADFFPGTVYVAVSGASNAFYDPVNGGGDSNGSTGAYTITFNGVDGSDPDDQAAEAVPVRGGFSYNGSINATDVDMFAVTVRAGETVQFDVDHPFGMFDSVLRLFNSAGQELAFSDDDPAPGEAGGAGEAYVRHTFAAAGTYYAGLSGAGNIAYDPATGEGDASGTTGPYQLVVTIAQAPPRVAQVYVNGTAWTDAFRGYLAAQGLGDAGHGFAVPGGTGQLDELPWANITQIAVRFDQPVMADANDLLVRGVNVPIYLNPTYGYDPATFTAIWMLDRPLADYGAANRQTADSVRLELNGDGPDGVRAAGPGGAYLDGEWTDGAAYPSGDGSQGGDFRFLLNVVPGDANRNGNVSPTDFGAVRASVGRSTSDVGSDPARSYSVFRDVNGNGNIAPTDLGVVRGNTGANIAGLPTPAALAPGSVRDELFGTSPIL